MTCTIVRWDSGRLEPCNGEIISTEDGQACDRCGVMYTPLAKPEKREGERERREK